MSGKHITESIFRMVFSCLLIIILVSLAACGTDWLYELPNGYGIDRVNSHQIVLVKNIGLDEISHEIVIGNYFVTDFCVLDDYILTTGISTRNMIATAKELEQTFRQYYAVNHITNELFGPFNHVEELKEKIQEWGISKDLIWNDTRKIQEDVAWDHETD